MSEQQAERDETVTVEVPKRLLERAEGNLEIVMSPSNYEKGGSFEAWAMCSGFPGDVWQLVEPESGEVLEEYDHGY